jgi:hypothetical protein
MVLPSISTVRIFCGTAENDSALASHAQPSYPRFLRRGPRTRSSCATHKVKPNCRHVGLLEFVVLRGHTLRRNSFDTCSGGSAHREAEEKTRLAYPGISYHQQLEHVIAAQHTSTASDSTRRSINHSVEPGSRHIAAAVALFLAADPPRPACVLSILSQIVSTRIRGGQERVALSLIPVGILARLASSGSFCAGRAAVLLHR